jgi:GT2 family glycosyltransferase
VPVDAVFDGERLSPHRVSVIICSRNRPGFLLEAVRSVLKADEVPGELVVVDQSDVASEALRSMDHVRSCRIRYLWSSERGVSRGRNAGLRIATGEVVAFTDDDVLVDRAWLGALVRPLAQSGLRSVTTGRVLPFAEAIPGIGAPTLVVSEAPAEYRGRIAKDVLQAGNMALYREVLLQLEGFDERLGPGTDFPAGEDNDLGFRLLSAGCVICYEPKAVIYHREWHSVAEYRSLRWRYGIGQGAYYAKHLKQSRGYMLGRLFRLLGRHSTLAFRRALREPRAATGHLAYIGGLFTGMGRWWARAVAARNEPAQPSASQRER